MSLSRWLQIYGLLWSVLGTFGLGFAAAITWSDVHPWNGMLVGGGLTMAIAAITTVLYVLVGFVEDATEVATSSEAKKAELACDQTADMVARVQRGVVLER